jgi:hypothetical protein
VIRLEKINLDTIAIAILMVHANSNLSLQLQHLDTKIDNFDLEELDFAVPKVKLKGLQLKYKQGISPTRPSVVTSTDSPNLKLSLGELDLSKISVVYEDEENKLKRRSTSKNYL